MSVYRCKVLGEIEVFEVSDGRKPNANSAYPQNIGPLAVLKHPLMDVGVGVRPLVNPSL